jgi:GNAT superfamily N-acetyltransferase
MSAAVTGAVRVGTPADTAATVTVLGDAFADGPVARWLDPDEATRVPRVHGYFGGVVAHALAQGTVHVVDPGGGIAGAALWLPYPDGTPEPAAAAGPDEEVLALLAAVGPEVAGRLGILDEALARRHPTGRHHHLSYVGVRADRQSTGVGSTLLAHHHALLDATGMPAYLEANDPRNRALYLRHGYVDQGVPIVLPDGPPIWPMWRAPRPR